MPPQREYRCWVLALAACLVAVAGLAGATLWFALSASDDAGHSWGSAQEQALVEEIAATSAAGEQMREHLEDAFATPEHREALPALVEDDENVVNVTTPTADLASPQRLVTPDLSELPEERNGPVMVQDDENVFAHSGHLEDIPALVRDGENAFVLLEEQNNLKEDPVMANMNNSVFGHLEDLPTMIRDGENVLLHPEERNKVKKTDAVIPQKDESVFVHPGYLEGLPMMIRDGENVYVYQEERNKVKKADPVISEKDGSMFVHPGYPEGLQTMIRDGENVFVHPEERNKVKKAESIMAQNSETVFMDLKHSSNPQKEPGFVNGYKTAFLPPEDDDRFPDEVHEHRNQLERLDTEDEHFFSQYFEYPHDREHPGQPEHTKVPWGVEHEEYLYKGPEQYDGEEPEYSESPIANFLQQKLQDLYNWISSDEDLVQGDTGTGRELLEVVQALNRSLAEGNSSLLVDKLKQLYQSRNGTPNIVQRNSLVSFGLLAFDLLLLRNVQQIAWAEDDVTARKMMKDPDVLALGALFLPPEEVRQLQDPGARQKDLEKEDKGMLYDIVEFINGSLRAVLNLGRAYRDGTNVLDCVWTLYCRNLDKSAGLRGPYGFLARINSVGLRLAMGDFPLENALELLVGNTATDAPSHIDCDKLFPRCKSQVAADVVLRSTLG